MGQKIVHCLGRISDQEFQKWITEWASNLHKERNAIHIKKISIHPFISIISRLANNIQHAFVLKEQFTSVTVGSRTRATNYCERVDSIKLPKLIKLVHSRQAGVPQS